MLSLERLQTFVTAAEHLNFTVAGDQLNLSQPSVSQHIRELETVLSVSLFERRRRKLTLTPAGEHLRPLAKALLVQAERTVEAMAAFRGMPQSIVRVGAGNTPGIYLMPHALGRFSGHDPGARVSLQVTDAQGIAKALHDGDIDVAVVSEKLPIGRLHGWQQEPLLDDDLVLIVAPDHPWARTGRTSLDHLATTQWIMRQSTSPTRQLILDRLTEAGFDTDRLAIRFEVGHTEGLKRAAQAGLGACFVSRYAITRELQAGWLVEVAVDPLHISRKLWLLSRPGARQSLHEQRFCAMLRQREWLPTPLTVGPHTAATIPPPV